ncbi:hypothetical protein XFF6991_570103 [Xanthomonas phaseoli pv. phaseoli]|uniref:Uncharacterized protein n=1 Tax=Xanthomonas campestris pv. phaseoli TaxID=317013 RepID=A0A7Z7J5E1_XANCH|nr:hypothetical protein XFF6991_570103 [Xanthomonas phaseoli pv. phaseoli]
MFDTMLAHAAKGSSAAWPWSCGRGVGAARAAILGRPCVRAGRLFMGAAGLNDRGRKRLKPDVGAVSVWGVCGYNASSAVTALGRVLAQGQAGDVERACVLGTAAWRRRHRCTAWILCARTWASGCDPATARAERPVS